MAHIYLEIRNYMIRQIEKGILNPGDKIPSERELVELFKVSRMTVRHAIDQLVNDGILVRMVGKGTYVSSERLSTSLNILKSFSEDIIASGHRPSAKLIGIERTVASESIASILRIAKSQEVIKVERLRLVDDLEMAITTSFFPVSRALPIDELDFSATSIYNQIESLGLRIEKAEETVTAQAADRRTAGFLRVKENSPLLMIMRLTLISNNVPIEYMEGLFRPDRYVISQELYRQEVRR
jgi:GntR family transcriptional regulator